MKPQHDYRRQARYLTTLCDLTNAALADDYLVGAMNLLESIEVAARQLRAEIELHEIAEMWDAR